MKQLIALTVLLTLVLLPIQAQAQKDLDDLPFGSRGMGVLIHDGHDTVFREWEKRKRIKEKEAAAKAASGATAKSLPAGVPATPANYPPYPMDQTFLLHSNPSATDKLYIDFTGYRKYKAFDMDGSPSTFNDEERLRIQQAWYCAAEDFMPFTIDVTTEEPPTGWPGARAVMDNSNGAGNWAYLHRWPDSSGVHMVCGVGDQSWIWMGTVVSHEVGHLLGSLDHGDDTTNYHTGNGSGATAWGPIMGWDSWSLGQWDNGEYLNAQYPKEHCIDNIF